MRVLGVDLGLKRIGIAVGETEHKISTPRPSLEAVGTLAKDAAQVSLVAEREQAEAVVVGVPFNDENPRMASVCMRFADELRKLGWQVETVDESLTSLEAASQLHESGLSGAQSKRRKDGVAAALILERYFGA